MAVRPAYWLYRWFWSGLDWLFPPCCGGCGRRGTRWCSECEERVETPRPPVCPICGQPQRSETTCRSCREAPPCYKALRSWAIFSGPARRAIHELKYKRNMALGEILSRRLIAVLSQAAWEVDMVIPVPLGIARLAERGYNQASLLARPVALGLGIPFYPQGLSRARETRSQVDLNAVERKENVAGAFQARPGLIRNRRILLVDDVATTGATLDACASALAAGGAASVFALTLARTSYKP
jgi:competence protein ComFC